MKKIRIFRLIIIVLIPFFISTCKTDEKLLNISSIGLESETEAVLLGQPIIVTAKNQDGVDITNDIDIYVDGVMIDGNEFTPIEIGVVTLQGRYNTVRSPSLGIRVIENITTLTLSADTETIKPTNYDVATFVAHNQDGEDVTSVVGFSKGEDDYDSTSFSTRQLGSFDFSVTYEGVVSNTITINSELSISSILIKADRTIIPANNNTKATFLALDQDEDTVTNFVSFYYGSEMLSENAFYSGTEGSHTILAKYEQIESNEVVITAEKPKKRKVLIEEFTGEWCGWCPQAAYNLDLLVQSNPAVLTVGIHNGDEFAYGNEGGLRGKFGINTFPSGVTGRVYLGQNVGFNDPTLSSAITDEVNRQLYEEEVMAGVSINSTISNGEAIIDVNVKFYGDIDEEVYTTIYLIENKVIGDVQENYFSGYSGFESSPFYSLPDKISDYEHNYVLRKAATDAFGDEIPEGETSLGNTYSLSQRTINLSGYNTDNCYIIAFTHYSLDATNKTIINAQQVKLGENIGFED